MSEAAFEQPEEADRMPLPRDPPPPPGYVDPLEGNPMLEEVSGAVTDAAPGPHGPRGSSVDTQGGPP